MCTAKQIALRDITADKPPKNNIDERIDMYIYDIEVLNKKIVLLEYKAEVAEGWFEKCGYLMDASDLTRTKQRKESNLRKLYEAKKLRK